MVRISQSPQQAAHVQSMIGLAYGQKQNWRLLGEDDPDEIFGVTMPTERARTVSCAGWPSWPHGVFSDQAIFDTLTKQWHAERGATSSITAMAMCPSYQRIIGTLGPKAVPLILRRLEEEGDEPDMWFWALRVITNENPVPDDAQGDAVKMAHAWLDWGRVRYVW